MGFIIEYDDNLSVEMRRESLTIHTGDAQQDYAPEDQFGHGHAELGFSTVVKFLLWLKQASEEGQLPVEIQTTFTDICSKDIDH